MKVDVTYNLDLDAGLFNGATGCIRAIHPNAIELEMAHGIIHIWRRYAIIPVGARQALRGAYDLRLGYAQTVHKAQGITLDRMVIVFELWSCAGWGFTAVSRAKTRAGIRIIGVPTPQHFQPRG